MKEYLLGPIPLMLYLAMLVFAGVGVFIRLLMDAVNRDQASTNTPEKFTFKFLFKDNWKVILLSTILILVALRFLAFFFPGQFTSEELSTPFGSEKWLFGSLIVGFLFQQLGQMLKGKSDLLKNR